MNEQIKSLLAKAHLEVMEDLGDIDTNQVAEKFAELIIKECEVALSPMLRDMISRGQGVELIKNHFGLLKVAENMSDKGYSIGTKEGYDAFVEKRSAGNRSETLE